MLDWLDSFFSIKVIIWLFPVAFMLHDFEEIIFVETWSRKNQKNLSKSVPVFLKTVIQKFSGITSYQFSFTVAIEFILLIPFTFAAAEYGNYYYISGINSLAFLHVFTHLGQSLLIKKLTPGVVTAVFITLPYSSYLFYHLLIEQLVDWHLVFASIPFGLLVIPVVLLGHYIGTKVLSCKENVNIQ